MMTADIVTFFCFCVWPQDYWDWSWDELVSYDLPATFQYVYDQTGQKLHYVGHSLVIANTFAGVFSNHNI